MLSLVALAIAAFAATNVDNLFVLLAFVAEARGHVGRVVFGQYAGSLALIVIAMGLAALLRSLPPGYVGLLGVLPIGVGLSKGWARFGPRRATPDDTGAQAVPPAKPGSAWWTVAGVAIANGSDNIAVYVPLYAGHSRLDCGVISLVFVVMIALWCAGAVWLVNHPLLGAPIRRYGTALLPVILLVVGFSVIAENDTLRLVFGL
ncbi:cadmium resistance transporter [Paraburkholderia sp. DHOC27]|uniref:cadmium resistance transporter n=1 Tax=Paraburkholderia sp. DHOC27 TaxID=2303330 RepID=UPI000E3BAE69|nr:cadmium resistance transporter [Paraburkholderia sp. DHOC27]RFU46507.1 cadmium transporter [Paraburkholderia sp. DHOC27]